jgi:hypothetical protein
MQPGCNRAVGDPVVGRAGKAVGVTDKSNYCLLYHTDAVATSITPIGCPADDLWGCHQVSPGNPTTQQYCCRVSPTGSLGRTYQMDSRTWGLHIHIISTQSRPLSPQTVGIDFVTAVWSHPTFSCSAPQHLSNPAHLALHPGVHSRFLVQLV